MWGYLQSSYYQTDLLDHRIQLVIHHRVREPDDMKPLSFQPGCAGLVMRFPAGMAAAVDLDHQLLLDAAEINDILPGRKLAPEFPAFQLPVAQAAPED